MEEDERRQRETEGGDERKEERGELMEVEGSGEERTGVKQSDKGEEVQDKGGEKRCVEEETGM